MRRRSPDLRAARTGCHLKGADHILVADWSVKVDILPVLKPEGRELHLRHRKLKMDYAMSPNEVLSSLEDFSRHVGCALGRSYHTNRAYISDTRCFAKFLIATNRSLEPSGSDFDLATAYVSWLRSVHANGPATIRRKLASLTTYIDWLLSERRLCSSPLEAKKPTVRLPKRLPRSVTRNNIKTILAACQTSNAADMDRTTELGLKIILATGVRVQELCSINVSDVDADGSAIRVRGKGNRERTVFVSNELLKTFLRKHCHTLESFSTEPLLKNKRGGRMTPQAFRLRLHNIRSSSGIGERITPHRLRHSAATLLIEAGIDIRFVQRLLGHASISTTEIYTHVADQSLRAALTRADTLNSL